LAAVGFMPAAGSTTERVVTYSVAGRGHVSDLEAFADFAADTYADPRGWGGGQVRFQRVETGGDFTLWLAADARMSTFGGSCDVVWSCRSGRNVVVNEDRWLGASPAWNESGAALTDYRRMVINHETGHWLGQDHQMCTAPGAAASVMQQQSMSLQGCTANPWPLPADQSRAAARLASFPVAPPSPERVPEGCVPTALARQAHACVS
jgi:hypothetical protein